jgi:hypothetical protein
MRKNRLSSCPEAVGHWFFLRLVLLDKLSLKYNLKDFYDGV